MSDKPFAVLCATKYRRRTNEMPPGVVAKIWKQTDKSIVGMKVNPSGREIDDYGSYDTRPSVRGHRENIVVSKPGRFDIERLLATFATVDEAYAALNAATKAWDAAEDRSEEKAARDRWQVARETLEARRKELEHEMREKLSAVKAEHDAAEQAMWQARSEKYAKMRDAALAAMSVESESPSL